MREAVYTQIAHWLKIEIIESVTDLLSLMHQKQAKRVTGHHCKKVKNHYLLHFTVINFI